METSDFSFERLDVYQRALSFAQTAWQITQKTRNASNRSWCDQFERAAMSIPLNIAEGSGRRFEKEKKSFYNIAQGSVFECVAVMGLGHRLCLLSEDVHSTLREDIIVIAKMLTRLIQSLE